ncbi:DUF6881 domain-containing protein [Streptomyces sp. NPDC002536]
MERPETEYWKVLWHHDFQEEPVVLIMEIDQDGYETKKVQEYRDGRILMADEHHEGRTIGLSEIAVGSIDEVAAQPEFSAHVISNAKFEEWWDRAQWPIHLGD